MKYIYKLLVCIAILLPANLLSQWEEVTKLPRQWLGNYWLEIFFLPQNQNYAWICGFDGIVLRSTDRGQTWSGVQIPNAGQLESIIFVNEKVGYTVSASNPSSSSYIFKTTDGGRTWENVSPKFDASYWGCYFLDEYTGVLLGGTCNSRYFFKTKDGGRTWTYQTSYDNYVVSDSKLSDVMLYNDGRGYALSSGFLWITTDYGDNWKVAKGIKSHNWHEELSILNNSILIPWDYSCAGSQKTGGAVFSKNKGNSWVQTDLGNACYGSFLLNDSTGWVCGLDRSIYRTDDYGATWTKKYCGIPVGTDLDDLYFIDDTTGWVVGKGIYKYKPVADTLSPKISADKVFLCKGEYAVIESPMKYENMKWNTGETSNKIVTDKPGIYYFKAWTNECDEGTSNIVRIDVYPKSELAYNNSAFTACEGDSVLVAITSKLSQVVWADGSNNQQRYFKTDGWKSFVWTDTTGCQYLDSINVKIVPMPLAEIKSISDTLLCFGKKLKIISTGKPANVDWYDGQSNQLISADTPEIEIDKSMSIYAIAKNELGCADTSEIKNYNIKYTSDNFEFINVNYDEYIFMDSLYSKEVSCKDIMIKNTSQNTVYLSKFILKGNTAFSIPQSQMPMRINSGEIKPVTVCYSPTALNLQKDTIVLNDVCSDKYIILGGFGKAWSNIVETKCGTPIKITLSKLSNGALFSTHTPYPNPAKTAVSIEYKIDSVNALDNKTQSHLKFELIELSGKILKISEDRIKKLTSSIANNTEQGIYSIDLKGISRGKYNLIISIDDKKQYHNIVVE